MNNAPATSTIKSHMVSTKPDFCRLNPKFESSVNSNISHIAPMATANVNENNAMKPGLKRLKIFFSSFRT